MDAVVILNSSAGALQGGSDALTVDALRAAFTAARRPVEVRLAPPAQLEAAIRTAISERPSAVIVGGGDGSVSTAAACLVETGIPLGALPLGTLNHFARDLGVPTQWTDAVPALARGEIRVIDVGDMNGRVFLNNCSIGSYPEAVRRRDQIRHLHRRGKWAAMVLASLQVFRRLRRFRLRIEIPDTTLELRTPFVFLGNNRYSGHLLAQNLRDRLDEAQLSIYTTRARRHFAVLRLVWRSLTRSIDETDGLETHFTPTATLTSLSGQPLPIALDGELVPPAAVLRCRIRPGALRVLAPPRPASTPASSHRVAAAHA